MRTARSRESMCPGLNTCQRGWQTKSWPRSEVREGSQRDYHRSQEKGVPKRSELHLPLDRLWGNWVMAMKSLAGGGEPVTGDSRSGKAGWLCQGTEEAKHSCGKTASSQPTGGPGQALFTHDTVMQGHSFLTAFSTSGIVPYGCGVCKSLSHHFEPLEERRNVVSYPQFWDTHRKPKAHWIKYIVFPIQSPYNIKITLT